jgi:hypothetical protein
MNADERGSELNDLRLSAFIRGSINAHKKRKLPPWLGSFLFCFEA